MSRRKKKHTGGQKKVLRARMSWKSGPTSMGEPYKRPEGDGPICWGYTRNSHRDSVESGLGYNAARQTITMEFKRLRERLSKGSTPIRLRAGKIFYDKAVSAYRVRFVDRPMGLRLMEVLRPGDHIIFPRVDRAFRWGKDAFMTLELLEKMGIVIHFCDMHCDSSTAAGKMMLGTMIVMAQWYSDFISERTKDALHQRRLKNRGSGRKKRFHRVIRYKGAMITLPLPTHRVAARWVKPVRECGYTLREMAVRLERYAAKKEGRALKLDDRDWMRSLAGWISCEYARQCESLGVKAISRKRIDLVRKQKGLPEIDRAKKDFSKRKRITIERKGPLRKNTLLRLHLTPQQFRDMTEQEREAEYQRLLLKMQ